MKAFTKRERELNMYHSFAYFANSYGIFPVILLIQYDYHWSAFFLMVALKTIPHCLENVDAITKSLQI
ncbi:hypothetical protein [Sicyoidochytrium minutum DNA virus]|nr:hypothetical protein [Sicyoidochytrium minutum DNA virus]